MDNNSLHMIDNRTIRVAIVGVLSILALFLLAETIGAVKNFGRPGNPATDTITVQGSGQVALPPDVARITFTVENSAATVAAAQEKTTTQANAALEYVRRQEIAEKDIRTMYYNISPKYSYPNPCPLGSICPEYIREPKITGYTVSESIEVTVRDLDKAGELLDGLGKLGVQNVSGPNLGLEDPTAGYNAARADAISKAKEQARVLADQLGVRLGKIVNFSESSSRYPYPVPAYGLGGSIVESKAMPDIPTGENTYTASVSITYEIR